MIERNTLKVNLQLCTEFQRNFFIKIYGKEGDSISDCVDNIPPDKLTRALDQVARTIINNVYKI